MWRRFYEAVTFQIVSAPTSRQVPSIAFSRPARSTDLELFASRRGTFFH
jgi:hypothetical protein